MRHILIYRLRTKHRELEQRLRDEMRRPQPDALRLAALKRQKLAIKDELLKLEQGRFHAIDA
jgi:hypothetical protein